MSWELELSISIKIVLSQLKCRFCTFQASERNCSHRWITKLQTSKFFVTKFYYGIAKLQLHKMDWIKQLSKEFDRQIGRCRQKNICGNKLAPKPVVLTRTRWATWSQFLNIEASFQAHRHIPLKFFFRIRKCLFFKDKTMILWRIWLRR